MISPLRVTSVWCPPFPCTWCCSQRWLLFIVLFFRVERTVNHAPKKANHPSNRAWQSLELNFHTCSAAEALVVIIHREQCSLKSGAMRCRASAIRGWHVKSADAPTRPGTPERRQKLLRWTQTETKIASYSSPLCWTHHSAGRCPVLPNFGQRIFQSSRLRGWMKWFVTNPTMCDEFERETKTRTSDEICSSE